MSTVFASATVPGTVDAVRALWFDTTRWPAFVDGFRTVVRADPGWPESGEIVWDSTPHGRGRVIERADGSFEDGQVSGTQVVRFETAGQGVVRVSAEQRYRIKERTIVTPVVDLLFVRRAVRDALGRTVRRFAAEARLEAELAGGRSA